MKTGFNLDKIKYRVDPQTFQKAVTLYEGNKVTDFKNLFDGFSAIVIGTQPYKVFVSNKKFDIGQCDCYLGQNDTLCKHMIAVAIFALKDGKKLTKEEKEQITHPISSGKAGWLDEKEINKIKKEITQAISYIKDYTGPSRTWFSYQDSLIEGVNRLAKIINQLPISNQTADLIVDVLLRLDKKLQYGVDDSDGTVGNFIEGTVEVLKDYTKVEKNIINSFKKLQSIESCFNWEEPLVSLFMTNDESAPILNQK